MFIFGLGYTAGRIAKALRESGWQVDATGQSGNIPFHDSAAVQAALRGANHVLSSVPPDRTSGADPVLSLYGEALGGKWIGYLSSTGVYGNTDGGWVDESAPTGTGIRSARAAADLHWLEMGARLFRLPGIYGPGRSALDRLRAGKARRINIPGQVFSRIHVDDIVSGVIAALDCGAPAGAYNLADDLPTSGNAVIEEACRLSGMALPPLQSLEEAGLSEMARSFYLESRRVANGKARRLLGWQPAYPTFREGLAALLQRKPRLISPDRGGGRLPARP